MFLNSVRLELKGSPDKQVTDTTVAIIEEMHSDAGARKEKPTLPIEKCREISIQNTHRKKSRRREREKLHPKNAKQHEDAGKNNQYRTYPLADFEVQVFGRIVALDDQPRPRNGSMSDVSQND